MLKIIVPMFLLANSFFAATVCADNKPVRLVNRTSEPVLVQLFWKVTAKVQASGLNSPAHWETGVVGRGHCVIYPGETKTRFPKFFSVTGTSNGKPKGGFLPDDSIDWNEVYIRVEKKHGAVRQNRRSSRFWVHPVDRFAYSSVERRVGRRPFYVDLGESKRRFFPEAATEAEASQGMRNLGFELKDHFYKYQCESSSGLTLNIY